MGASTDIWLTSQATMTGEPAPLSDVPPAPDKFANKTWRDITSELDLLLAVDRMGVDNAAATGRSVVNFISGPQHVGQAGSGPYSVVASSQLSGPVSQIAASSGQVNGIAPLLMVQLALLGVVVLWMVLEAAISQRRPEIAVARLIGKSSRATGRLVFAELMVSVLLGVPLGMAEGVLLWAIARQAWLRGLPPWELTWQTPVALLAAVIALLLITVVAVRGPVRAPILGLLREVPSRRTGWALGVGQAMIVAGSAMGFVALVTHSLTGAIAVAAPSMLALAVGFLLAHLIGVVAGPVGAALLRAGRPSAPVSAFFVARRPAMHKVVASITVATALLVFTAEAVAVGQTARSARAQAETGAAAVQYLNSSDLAATLGVINKLDPSGMSVTPVALAVPPDAGVATMAVLPAAYRKIALFPGMDVGSLRWAALDPPREKPIELTGRTMTLTLASDPISPVAESTDPSSPPQRPLPTRLLLHVVTAFGRDVTVVIGDLPVAGAAPHPISVSIPCQDRCLLKAFSAAVPPTSERFQTEAAMSDIRIDGTAVSLGASDDWHTFADDTGSVGLTVDRPDSAHLLVISGSSDELISTHKAIPVSMPALTAGPVAAEQLGTEFLAPGLDGTSQPMHQAGTTKLVPGATATTALVNLDVLRRQGLPLIGSTQLMLFYAAHTKGLQRNVEAALRAVGVPVAKTQTPALAQQQYDRSAAAWSMRLGFVVGIAAFLISALILVITVATSARGRIRDNCGLQLGGTPRRFIRQIAIGEQLPVIVAAVVAGGVCGAVGAHYTMPTVPLFLTPPDLPVVNLALQWPMLALVVLGALAFLVLIGFLTGRRLAARSSVQRFRDTV